MNKTCKVLSGIIAINWINFAIINKTFQNSSMSNKN